MHESHRSVFDRLVMFAGLLILASLGCPKMTKVLKCYAPYAFSGAKFQVILENGHEIDAG